MHLNIPYVLSFVLLLLPLCISYIPIVQNVWNFEYRRIGKDIIIIIIQISNTTNFDQDNGRWENSKSHKTSRGDKSSLYTWQYPLSIKTCIQLRVCLRMLVSPAHEKNQKMSSVVLLFFVYVNHVMVVHEYLLKGYKTWHRKRWGGSFLTHVVTSANGLYLWTQVHHAVVKMQHCCSSM